MVLKDFLTTIALHPLDIEELVEFDKYFNHQFFMRRYIMIAVLLPVGRDQIHMTEPRNILTTITLYH